MRESPRGRGLWAWVAGDPQAAARRRVGAVATFLVLAGVVLALPPSRTTSVTLPVIETPDAREPAVRMAVRAWAADDHDRALVDAVAIDIWSEHVAVGDPIDVVVDRRGLSTLQDAGVRTEVITADIDAVAQAEQLRLQEAQAQRPVDWFAEYKDFAAIAGYAEDLAARYPALAQLHTIGTSIEGRPLVALRIAGTGDDPVRLAINGGQHAREWIAAMVPVCVADRLLRGYDTDPALRAFLDRTSVWIVPVVNPDGYEYSWRTDRYWRKNRRGDHGVDLNRNFGVAWGERGASDDPSSPIYHGDHPFSEPEAAAMRDLLRRERIEGHIDFHSYSQLVLHPWSFTAKPAPERALLATIADRIASAMYATHRVRYTVKSGAGLYPASGTLMDWAYGERDAITYVVELRPKGGSGFVLPPDQIVPTCEESLAAVIAMGDALAEHRNR